MSSRRATDAEIVRSVLVGFREGQTWRDSAGQAWYISDVFLLVVLLLDGSLTPLRGSAPRTVTKNELQVEVGAGTLWLEEDPDEVL